MKASERARQAAQRFLDREMGDRDTVVGVLNQCIRNAKTQAARFRLKYVLVELRHCR